VNALDRQATWDYWRGRCGACGELLGELGVVHHRKAKGMGGTSDPDKDKPPRTIPLHDSGHKWVHANPKLARQYGLIVPQWADPATVPVTRVPAEYGACRP